MDIAEDWDIAGRGTAGRRARQRVKNLGFFTAAKAETGHGRPFPREN